MLLFLDSAKIDEIKHALDVWNVDGVTTNPRHVYAGGRPLRDTLSIIADLFYGTDKAVSVEVNPHLSDWEAIVAEGLELRKMSANFVIKVGASESGFRAIRELTARGVPTNATLIFSTAQAWHAARAGAAYVSPFVGWRETHGDAALPLISETVRMLENFRYPAKVIVAAVRNSRQMADAAVAGAHCVTAGFEVIRDSFANPYTTMGESRFKDAWDKIPRSAP